MVRCYVNRLLLAPFIKRNPPNGHRTRQVQPWAITELESGARLGKLERGRAQRDAPWRQRQFPFSTVGCCSQRKREKACIILALETEPETVLVKLVKLLETIYSAQIDKPRARTNDVVCRRHRWSSVLDPSLPLDLAFYQSLPSPLPHTCLFLSDSPSSPSQHPWSSQSTSFMRCCGSL